MNTYTLMMVFFLTVGLLTALGVAVGMSYAL